MADTHPDWYYNLAANPAVTVEVGSATNSFRARIAIGNERETIWSKQKHDFPGFAEYESKTPREIPVVILDPT